MPKEKLNRQRLLVLSRQIRQQPRFVTLFNYSSHLKLSQIKS